MALTGFDPDAVLRTLDKIQESYDELVFSLSDELQNKFINEISDKWACTEAQNFFQKFKISIDELIVNVNQTFESIVISMNDAARTWSSQTGIIWNNQLLNIQNKVIDVSNIQENIGGVRGIDPTIVTYYDRLNHVVIAVSNSLTKVEHAVINCGFVGGNAETQLIESLRIIKRKIEEVMMHITNECKIAIDNTVTSYSNLSAEVSNAFTSN